MKTERERAASFIDSLNTSDQITFLARLIYELTLAGRSCYTVDAPGLDHPVRLRAINELQHKMSAQIMNIASNTGQGLPSIVLVDFFLKSEYRDEMLAGEVRRALIDALAASVKAK